ncbi:MAG: hypothetical protein KatS3mg026_1416 [Bacteroidia bacterium]|nr:MAG: hypothetical protein KatS3mg026_1416 [Bacteroidia bacterium]
MLPPLKNLPDSIRQNGVHRDLVLRRIQRLRVWGYVTDAEKKTPIQGATVRLTTQSGEVIAELSTDSRGQYEAQVPLGLNHRLQSEAQGYDPRLAGVLLGKGTLSAGAAA